MKQILLTLVLVICALLSLTELLETILWMMDDFFYSSLLGDIKGALFKINSPDVENKILSFIFNNKLELFLGLIFTMIYRSYTTIIRLRTELLVFIFLLALVLALTGAFDIWFYNVLVSNDEFITWGRFPKELRYMSMLVSSLHELFYIVFGVIIIFSARKIKAAVGHKDTLLFCFKLLGWSLILRAAIFPVINLIGLYFVKNHLQTLKQIGPLLTDNLLLIYNVIFSLFNALPMLFIGSLALILIIRRQDKKVENIPIAEAV